MSVVVTRDWIDHVTAIAVLLTALAAVTGMLAATRDAARARKREQEEASYSKAHKGRADAMAALHRAHLGDEPHVELDAVADEIANLNMFLTMANQYSDTHRAELFAREVATLEARLAELRTKLGDPDDA